MPDKQPAKLTSNQGIAVIATLGIAAAVFAVRCTDFVKEDAAQAEVASKQRAEAAQSAPRISAPELWSAFEANEVAAEKKYGDGPLVVVGELVEISKALGSVMLRMAGGPGSPVVAQLERTQREEDKAAALKVGDGVIVLCNGCMKMLGAPSLRGCKIGKVAD